MDLKRFEKLKILSNDFHDYLITVIEKLKKEASYIHGNIDYVIYNNCYLGQSPIFSDCKIFCKNCDFEINFLIEYNENNKIGLINQTKTKKNNKKKYYCFKNK